MSTANLLGADLVETFREAATSADPDLATPALLIARLGYPHLETAAHLAHLHDMGQAAAKRLSVDDGPDAPHGPIDSLNRYLFDEQGFRGNSTDYEDPRNSFLNQVLERRTGIPITLAVVYIEVARRAGVRVDGVNFPGHFLLRFPFGPDEDHGGAVFVDPFHRGAVMSETDCRALLKQRGRRCGRIRAGDARACHQTADPGPNARELETHLRGDALISPRSRANRTTSLHRTVSIDRTPGSRAPRLPSQRLLHGTAKSRGLSAIRSPAGP